MRIHVVRPGESLGSIARRYGADERSLAQLNQLTLPDRLVPGLALAIADGETPRRREALVTAWAFPSLSAAAAAEQMEDFSLFGCFSHAMTAEGGVISPEDAPLPAAARDGGAAALLTVSNIGPGGGFSGDIAHAVLSDSGRQEALLARVLALAEERDCRGVQFHLQYLYPFDREAYSAFLRRAAERVHRAGLLLLTAVAPKESDEQGALLYGAHDYAAHGACADYVTVMSYEWGHTYSEPRAVSPLDAVRRVLDHAAERIAPHKLLLGFSNYGYNWTLPWKQGEAASVISNSAAANLAVSVGAEIAFDPTAAAPHFRYTDAAGLRHQVWFEDVRSAMARMKLVREYALGGLSYWTVNHLNRPMLLVQESLLEPIRFG